MTRGELVVVVFFVLAIAIVGGFFYRRAYVS